MKSLNWTPLTDSADALGESPFWHPQEAALYWIDIPGRALRRADAATGAQQRWSLPSEPGCIGPMAGGGLLLALREGLFRARHLGAALERLVAAPYDPATTRFNDGRADAEGRLWVGTIYEPRDKPEAALYCFDPRGAPGLTRRAGGATTGNGLAFSPDGRTLYWSDTPDHVIRAWDLEPLTGTLTRPREFHRFAPKPAGWSPSGDPLRDTARYGGRPDGAAVDAEGYYWVAMFEGGRLLRLAPDGRVVSDWPLPVRCPTMPCFGGEDLCTLYLTTARQGRSAAELAACPLSGHVLWTRVEVPGLPVNFCANPGPGVAPGPAQALPQGLADGSSEGPLPGRSAHPLRGD